VFNRSLDLSLPNGHSGVEAAETRESDARERGRECSARDGIVGVAQYVIPYPTARRGKESNIWNLPVNRSQPRIGKISVDLREAPATEELSDG
jgi:hypothetical protein